MQLQPHGIYTHLTDTLNLDDFEDHNSALVERPAAALNIANNVGIAKKSVSPMCHFYGTLRGLTA